MAAIASASGEVITSKSSEPCSESIWPPSTLQRCAPFVLHSTVKGSDSGKPGILYRQNEMPGNAMFIVFS